MRRACVLLCLILTVCCAAATSYASESVNLLSNGGFELLDENGEPAEWYPNAYWTQDGYSEIAVTDEKAHSGKYSAVVENFDSNDARFVCTVEVEPSSMYRISGYVLVESMEDFGNGANFGIEGLYAYSDCLFDTDGDWYYLEWYGETSETQTELTFGVRVGGYGSESVGKAYFDDIAFEKVDALPAGVIASVWYAFESDEPYSAADAAEQLEQTPEKQTALLIGCAFLFLLLYLFLRPLLEKKNASYAVYVFAGLMVAALACRIVLAMKVSGYSVDINCFSAWSLRMAEKGAVGFYPEGFYNPDVYFCDYPPGYMLLLWPCGLLLKLIGLSGAAGGSELSLLVIKSVPILCDMLGAIVLFAVSKKRLSNVSAAFLATLYALNPAVLVNGAAWGQADSVLAFLMLLTAVAAVKRKWHFAIPLFFISALTKPQALLFAPVGGVWLLMCLFGKRDKESGQKEWCSVLVGVGAGVLAAAAIIIPFSLEQENPLAGLIRLYSATLGSYSYASLNTANLYYLAGANWTSLETAVSWRLPAVTALFFAAVASLILIRAKKPDWHKRETVLSGLSFLMAIVQLVFAFCSISYSVYGYSMMAYVFLYALICMLYENRAESLPFYMALALIGVYVLGVKIHERYLFPAFLLLMLAYALTRDRRMLALCVGFSLTTFLNTAIVLENSILYGSAQGHLNPDTLPLNVILCLLNLLLCGYAGNVALTGLHETQRAPIPEKPAAPPSYTRMLFSPADARLHLTVRDYAVMAATAVVYAALAFTNLGSTVAPQTAWVSTSSDEQVVFDLGESRTFSILYYAGVSYNDFSVAVSEDGENWSDAYPCQMREGLCYRWVYAVNAETVGGETSYSSESPDTIHWFTGRYLRLNAVRSGLNLWEIVARDTDGVNLPMTVVSHTGADVSYPAENLIDESDTCLGEPGWYTGTYFDEIYHARTGYELLHGETVYEWTHPPLGKLLMSLSIAVFGMTPFGWRFAGAFIGVLMLPALYLFALQLTHKRSVAAVSMLAFALDLMHYTQTRIATIDSFPVFFIILSYLCMVRYMQTDVLVTSDPQRLRVCDRAYLKTLIPLLLSGIFMGLGIASKWIGMYSAVGLAVLFFISIYRQFRLSNVACGYALNEKKLENEICIRVAQTLTLKRILLTCAFCVLFFLVIPALIYCLCYIPVFASRGPMTVLEFIKELILEQKRIFDYHSTPGLGMDHPFQSPWWQWPFILKPMWFAQDKFEPSGYASTIMCMGNPWVFYLGAVAMAAVIVAFILKYVRLRDRVSLRDGDGDLSLAVIVVGFLAQYLPWVLVPRSMYMYHYFASVPFIILATAWLIDRIPARCRRTRLGVMIGYLVGAAILFVVFFPYASGWLTGTDWLSGLRTYFPTLYY